MRTAGGDLERSARQMLAADVGKVRAADRGWNGPMRFDAQPVRSLEIRADVHQRAGAQHLAVLGQRGFGGRSPAHDESLGSPTAGEGDG